MSQNIFKIYDGRTNFWQWDTGQKLIVLGSSIDQVHFAHKDMTHALKENVYMDDNGLMVCNVPDIVLQLPKTLIVYAYIIDDNGNRTKYSVKFAVNPRPIPDNYIFDQDRYLENLEHRVTSLETHPSDWEQTDETAIDYIRNKPELNFYTLTGTTDAPIDLDMLIDPGIYIVYGCIVCGTDDAWLDEYVASTRILVVAPSVTIDSDDYIYQYIVDPRNPLHRAKVNGAWGWMQKSDYRVASFTNIGGIRSGSDITVDGSGNVIVNSSIKATQDASGNVITDIYATKSELPVIATDEDVLDFLADMGMITPVTNSSGEILISSSNEIYSL